MAYIIGPKIKIEPTSVEVKGNISETNNEIKVGMKISLV